MNVGDNVTQLIGGIMPNPLTVTFVNPMAGYVDCGGVRFCLLSGMEIDDDKQWGPAHETTGSYLKEILDTNAQARKEARIMKAILEAEEHDDT